MDKEVKYLYKKLETLHFDKPFNSLAKSINIIITSNIDDKVKLDSVRSIVSHYFDEIEKLQ